MKQSTGRRKRSLQGAESDEGSGPRLFTVAPGHLWAHSSVCRIKRVRAHTRAREHLWARSSASITRCTAPCARDSESRGTPDRATAVTRYPRQSNCGHAVPPTEKLRSRGTPDRVTAVTRYPRQSNCGHVVPPTEQLRSRGTPSSARARTLIRVSARLSLYQRIRSASAHGVRAAHMP
jgi:hypothetical protein